MTHYTTPSAPPSFGSLTWEYVPKQQGTQGFINFALALAFPGCILLYFGGIHLSIIFLLPACIFIGLAFRMRKHRILFYERGVEDVQASRIRSSSYDQLKIWQYTQTNDIRGLSAANLHSYIVKFPDNSTLRSFEPEVGERLQHCIAQDQTDRIISDYEKGENIDFGPIRMSNQGIGSSMDAGEKMISDLVASGVFFYPTSSTFNKNPRSKVIPWSEVKTIRLMSGTLHITKLQGRNISIKAADIPNILVLMSLLQHLGY